VELWPDDGEHIELCWGDARPGNQMFDGTELIAVFDWEMVSLGNAESDLGWWLFLQRFSSEGMGATLLPGMLDEAATIAVWEEAMGRKAVNVDFYKKLAGFHFTLVMMRICEVMGAPENALHSPVLAMTAEMLDLPHPSTFASA
jgi:aminoglycoside phosphotransferase (APT) family kinase protein